MPPHARSLRRLRSDPLRSNGDRARAGASNLRRDRCELALRLHGEGLPTREIARRLGASRNAVRRWARAGRFVPYRRAPGSSRLDRHLSFAEAWWHDGQHNATTLHRELRAQGFTGGYDIIRRWAARRRKSAPVRPSASRSVAARAHAVLMLDGAGWHSAHDLVVPGNITLLPLPHHPVAAAALRP